MQMMFSNAYTNQVIINERCSFAVFSSNKFDFSKNVHSFPCLCPQVAMAAHLRDNIKTRKEQTRRNRMKQWQSSPYRVREEKGDFRVRVRASSAPSSRAAVLMLFYSHSQLISMYQVPIFTPGWRKCTSKVTCSRLQ